MIDRTNVTLESRRLWPRRTRYKVISANTKHFPLPERIGQEEDHLTGGKFVQRGFAAFDSEHIKNIVERVDAQPVAGYDRDAQNAPDRPSSLGVYYV
jgi:hypothetical protein